MRVNDLRNVISAGISYTYYPVEFPQSAVSNSAYVRLTGGRSPDFELAGTVAHPSFQVVVRGDNLIATDGKAWEIYDWLNGKHNFAVGIWRVVSCVADQSAPIYVGKDANGRFLYSLNFTCEVLRES